MKNVTKTEIILSVLGFSILFYILTYLIPHIDEFNLNEKFYANSQYLNEQSGVLPIYKQDKKNGGLRNTNSYKTPFRTTSDIFNQETLLDETANSIVPAAAIPRQKVMVLRAPMASVSRPEGRQATA